MLSDARSAARARRVRALRARRGALRYAAWPRSSPSAAWRSPWSSPLPFVLLLLDVGRSARCAAADSPCAGSSAREAAALALSRRRECELVFVAQARAAPRWTLLASRAPTSNAARERPDRVRPRATCASAAGPTGPCRASTRILCSPDGRSTLDFSRANPRRCSFSVAASALALARRHRGRPRPLPSGGSGSSVRSFR